MDPYPVKIEFRHLDNTRVVEKIIGIGGSGIIIQQGHYRLRYLEYLGSLSETGFLLSREG